ncbi:MAG: hypothetical protein ACYTBJ_11950 [Planctomycetota bacterium]|jgi:Ni/Co efflux regulator RcnB
MKKTLFSMVLLVVFYGAPCAIAQAEKAAGDTPPRDVPGKQLKADPNAPLNRAKAPQAGSRQRELERLEKMKQDRWKARQEMMRAKFEAARRGEVEPPGKAQSEKARNQQQQLQSLTKQLAQEDKKHLKRQARLDRIRELAAKENSEETLTRVDRLIEKEKSRHDSRRQRIQRHMKMIKRMLDKQKGRPAPGGAGRQRPPLPTKGPYPAAPKRPPRVKPSIPVEKKAESNDL